MLFKHGADLVGETSKLLKAECCFLVESHANGFEQRINPDDPGRWHQMLNVSAIRPTIATNREKLRGAAVEDAKVLSADHGGQGWVV